jgi:hypothetical protein
MAPFLLWCILPVLCWPLAFLALLVCPDVWLLLLPFRLMGIAVAGALDLVRAIIAPAPTRPPGQPPTGGCPLGKVSPRPRQRCESSLTYATM